MFASRYVGMSDLFVGNRWLFWADGIFSNRLFDVECPERSGGNSEAFNENDNTSLKEE